jgi:hypothetical protein
MAVSFARLSFARLARCEQRWVRCYELEGMECVECAPKPPDAPPDVSTRPAPKGRTLEELLRPLVAPLALAAVCLILTATALVLFFFAFDAEERESATAVASGISNASNATNSSS